MCETPPPPKARSLYIHIPFCFHKCHYCDFYSIVDSRDRMGPFVDRLVRELGAQAPLAGRIETVFVGGGTPTLLGAAHWHRLLTAMSSLFDLAPDAEFTVEANPETVDAELLAVLAGGGVNRLSIGAQSFNPAHLQTLERWHEPHSVDRAVSLARAGGIGRLSLDLIHAIPGQTIAEWDDDLSRALALGVDHLSCYTLTYEPGTAMTARRDRGLVEQADSDLEADFYEHTLARLRGVGFERYEVSNFARTNTDGGPCRHNLAYWQMHDWLACGPSGSGHLDGHRWRNTPRLDDYLRFDEAGFGAMIDHEPPDPRRALSEKIMLGLRLADGLDAGDVLENAGEIGEDSPGRLTKKIDELVALGWLDPSSTRWVLTDSGFLFADRAASELMDAIVKDQ